MGIGAAGAVLGAEVCTPLLLACWLLCCWPDENSDDASSSGKHPKKPVVAREWSRRRGSSTRGGSAASLHLPGPSGQTRIPLSAHRSHEELRGGAGGAGVVGDAGGDDGSEGGRYHSAPSVIDEVMRRRVWRSTRDLTHDEPASPPPAAAAPPPAPCKKHHTNIKSSRRDVTSAGGGDVTTRFYIGPEGAGAGAGGSVLRDVIEQLQGREEARRCLYRAKEGKQWFNESVRAARGSRSGAHRRPHGAAHAPPAHPPPSVEPAPYESSACYLSADVTGGGVVGAPAVGGRGARHASDGDILAAAPRPESGAFSESDVDLTLRDAAVPLPTPRVSPPRQSRETAI